MNDVPPEVWITGQAISSASSFTCCWVREVCTPWPTSSDRALGRADQLRGLGDLARAGTLVDQTIAVGRQGIRYIELFEDDVRRELDIARPRRA